MESWKLRSCGTVEQTSTHDMAFILIRLKTFPPTESVESTRRTKNRSPVTAGAEAGRTSMSGEA